MFKIVRLNLDKILGFSTTDNFFRHTKRKWTYSSVKGLLKCYTSLKPQMTVSSRKHCQQPFVILTLNE